MSNAAPALDDWRNLYNRIGALLFENYLEPTPDTFEVCYRYLVGSDTSFNSLVDRAIRQSGGLTAVAVAAIIARDTVDMSVGDLSRIADDAQSYLEQIEKILGKSGEHAREYGEALEGKVNDLAQDTPPPMTVESLIGLTQTMIERTRAAEEDMRRTGVEISTLREDLAQANRVANSDPLTGLPNRRALDVRVRSAIENARHKREPLSVAICDIDHFKLFNDTHGHQIGDEVLKFVAGSLGRNTGDQRFAARYGGEEFFLLFEGLDAEAAAGEVNRIRGEVAARDLKITATGQTLGKVSFSAGVATLGKRDDPISLLKRADKALYRAKENGRNQVAIAAPSG